MSRHAHYASVVIFSFVQQINSIIIISSILVTWEKGSVVTRDGHECFYQMSPDSGGYTSEPVHVD